MFALLYHWGRADLARMIEPTNLLLGDGPLLSLTAGYPLTLAVLAAGLIAAFAFPVWFIWPGAAALWLGLLSLAVEWAWRGWSTGQWPLGAASTAMAVLLTYLFPRLLHLLAVHWRTFGLRDGRSRDFDPLPSQERLVGHLQQLCESRISYQSPEVVNINADWGGGKTTILMALKRRLDAAGIATVYFNAWEHQRDPLPETALFRAIASEWRVLAPWGWLAVPALVLQGALLPKTLKIISKAGAVQSEAQFDVAPPPDVFWHNTLRRLARIVMAHGRGRGIVVMLDEVDRCDPVAAQRFLTLVRRGLAAPGVLVILPTVKHQLFAKAFNPLVPQLPDLRSTFHAILWGNMSPHVDADVFNAVLQGNGALATDDGGWPHYSGALARMAASQFLDLDGSSRERICRLMAEKYLSDRGVDLTGPTEDDFVHLCDLNGHAALPEQVRRLVWRQRGANAALSMRDLAGLLRSTESTLAKLAPANQALLLRVTVLLLQLRLRSTWRSLPAFSDGWTATIRQP
ncbi:MAG: P-loop NTPase fold protein [Pseudomonadota bacterium]